MIKTKCENLAMLLDLNSREWIEMKRNQKKQQLSQKDLFDIDDLIEILTYVINIYLLKNINNQVALFVFDESSTQLIFPRDQKDYELQKMMNLIEIKRVIFERIFNYLKNKQALNKSHSQLVQSFYRAICWLKKTQSTKQNQMKVYNRILVCLISNIKEEDCFNLMNCIQACVSGVKQKEHCSRFLDSFRKKSLKLFIISKLKDQRIIFTNTTYNRQKYC